MAWLPVIERELRVTARRRATHLLRVSAGSVAMVVWIVCLWGASQMPATALGHWLFVWVSSLLLGGCILCGAFITSDVLSEEKRSGTLGLLFLTPLKTHELLFGKLVSCSINAFFGLVATLPVLALPLLMGGVTFAEFIRVVAVLLFTIFWSCCIGLFESAGTASAQTSLARTLAWTIGLSGLFPLMALFVVSFSSRSVWDSLLLWPSSALAFHNALESAIALPGGNLRFWATSCWTLILAVAFLSGALIRLRRLVRDDVVAPSAVQVSSRFNRSKRFRLGSRNPFCWLASRNRWARQAVRWSLGCLLPIAGAAYLAALVSKRPVPFPLMITFISLYASHQLLKVIVPIEASRQMNQDRHSGALELLLSTPLPIETILRGQISSLRTRFEAAAVVLTISNVLALAGTLAAAGHFELGDSEEHFLFGLMVIGGTVLLWVDCYALSWVATWKGLLAGRHHRAVLSTIGAVMAAPWFCIFLLFAGLGDKVDSAKAMITCVLVWIISSILLDLVLADRAKRQLRFHFREIVAEGKPRHPSVSKLLFPPEGLAIPRVELK